MCDDFFDDMDGMDDSSFDPSDDFQEDLFDEQNDGIEGLIDDEPNGQEFTHDDENRQFDMADAVIMGSMIAGNAYEEAIDEKRRAELIKKMREKNRRNK